MRLTKFFAATALASGMLMLSSQSFAQATSNEPLPNDQDEITNADGTTVETGEDIVVTGSRIRRPNYDSLEPTVSVNAEYIETRGLTNVAQALNELPGFRGSATPAGDQSSFGVGVNFVNGFGIGTNRTLALIDGRRVVSSNTPTIFGPAAPGLQVDLNIIPTALVERIDVIAVGGAPTYGSDAIAGVTNVILKSNFEGLDVRATAGITERGDNARYNFTAVAGTNFAEGRGNVTASLSYDQSDGVLGTQRERTLGQFFTVTNPSAATAAILGPPGRTAANDGRFLTTTPFNESGTDGVSGGVLIRDRRIFALTRGGVLSSGALGLRPIPFNGLASSNFKVGQFPAAQFDRNGNLVPFDTGTRFTLTGIDASGGDGFNLAEFVQITSDVERVTGTLSGNYELTNNIRVFADGLYYNATARELVNQPIFNADSFGGASGALAFTIDNPFLTAQARQTLVNAGYTSGQRITYSRGSADIVTPRPVSNTELYRIVAGVEGDFQIGERDFYFEAYVNYGKNTSEFLDTGLNQQRFANAVNVTRNAAGQIVCNATGITAANNAAPGGVLPIADASCVPLDLFGEGRASAAARAYVTESTRAVAELEQKIFNANVGGSLFDIWGGAVAFNVGYEHREETASFTPDAFLQQGRGRSVAIAPVTGSFNVDEVFGEVVVPLVSPDTGLSFLNKLELQGKGRYVDNTVNGGFFSWTAGGAIAPIRDIEFRGNFTRSFRAPAVTELFSPRTNIFTFVTDVCSPANIGGGPTPEIRRSNCAAFLRDFPNATPLVAASASVPGISGGNPDLENEVSDSFTYGVVLRPSFIPRLNISVDYISFDIRNPIASLTAVQIAAACFDNPVFNQADPANGNQFCSLIRRDANGQVINDPLNPGVNTAFVNGNRIKFNGIQAAADYSLPVGPGTLSLDGKLLFTRYRLVDITGVAPLRSDGIVNDPEFAGQMNIAYDLPTVGAAVSLNYTGEQLNTRTATVETTEFLEYPDYLTVNLSTYFRFNDRSRFVLSVTNLTDMLGPFPLTQETLGRRFSATFQARF